MIHATREERNWLLRNFALGLVDYLGAMHPPVWVENLLKQPPPVYTSEFAVVRPSNGDWIPVYERPSYQEAWNARPWELPIDERRYAIAREILVSLGGSSHGRQMGLPELLVADLEACQDYFARVLLAPDPLVARYQKQGKDLRGFAETFLLPTRIAAQRWDDPIFG
jgi:hypothetical protein